MMNPVIYPKFSFIPIIYHFLYPIIKKRFVLFLDLLVTKLLIQIFVLFSLLPLCQFFNHCFNFDVERCRIKLRNHCLVLFLNLVLVKEKSQTCVLLLQL